MTITVPARVPFVDLAAQHREVGAEVQRGFDRVIASGGFIGGDEVGAFEQEYGEFGGVAHCVGVANGTDALMLILRALGIGPGDEVVVPVNTFVATAEAVAAVGAAPVFADCDPSTLVVDPSALEAAFTSRTAAILPVHLYGQLAPMEELAAIAGRHGVAVVEDAAQAQGATRNGRAAGAWGVAAGTSFYPGKNLGAYGDAGAVLTNDAHLARRVRLLGDHGSAVKYEHEVVGGNSRLDALQAVVLRAKLRRLASWNAARALAAERYATLLAGVDGASCPQVAIGNASVWHLFVVRVHEGRRDHVRYELQVEGIETGIHYPVPLHRQPAFATAEGARRGAFPAAEGAAGELLSLPMHPHLSLTDQERVVDALARALA